MTPSQFLNLPRAEKAFIYAAVDIKAEQEKKRLRDSKRKR